MLSYGAIVWSRITEKAGPRKRLQSLQRLALTSMGFFRRSTPTAGIELITFTTPLWLHIKQEAALAYMRTDGIQKFPSHTIEVFNQPNTIGHRQFLRNFLVNIDYTHVPTDTVPEFRFWDRRYTVDTASFQKGEVAPDGDVKIFTDGSKVRDGRTGSGMVV